MWWRWEPFEEARAPLGKLTRSGPDRDAILGEIAQSYYWTGVIYGRDGGHRFRRVVADRPRWAGHQRPPPLDYVLIVRNESPCGPRRRLLALRAVRVGLIRVLSRARRFLARSVGRAFAAHIVQLDAQTVNAVVRFVDCLEEFVLLKESQCFKPTSAAVEEREHRADAVVQCSQLFAGEARVHRNSV